MIREKEKKKEGGDRKETGLGVRIGKDRDLGGSSMIKIWKMRRQRQSCKMSQLLENSHFISLYRDGGGELVREEEVG